MKRDIRGKSLNNGDLVLKIVGDKGTSNKLEYSVVLNEKAFYIHFGNTASTFNNTLSNQIVKVENLTEAEENKRKDIISAVAASENKFFGKETIEIAKELERELVKRHD